MAGLTVHSGLPLLGLTQLWFPTVLCCSKQQLLLLTQRQKVTRHLPLRHSAGVTHLTPSRHAGILFSYLFTGRRVSATQDCILVEERGHVHTSLMTVQGYTCSILLLLSISSCAWFILYVYQRGLCVCAHAHAGRHIGSVKSARPLLSGTRRGLGRYPCAWEGPVCKQLQQTSELCLSSVRFPGLLNREKLIHLIFTDFPLPFLSWEKNACSKEDQAWLDFINVIVKAIKVWF